MILIRDGRVIDPASGTDKVQDVLLDGAGIERTGPSISAPDAEILDARDLIVAPGFIDLHCHLREPGQDISETIETGTRAAARGGFTAVCCMPNTHPVNDNASVTRSIVERAAAGASVRVWPIGAVSMGSKGEALAEIAAMLDAGIVAVSDDGRPVATAKLMRQAMDYCRSLGLPVIEHCEDPSLAAGGVMREGPRSVRLGLKGIPAESESICVGRDVEIAALTGARLHIAHLSARASLAHVRAAKKQGLAVTCEVTPHHFTLIDEDVVLRHALQNESPASLARRSRSVTRRPGRRRRRCHRHRSRPASSRKQGRRIRSRPVRHHRLRDRTSSRTRRAGAHEAHFADAPGRTFHHRSRAHSRHRAKNCRRRARRSDNFFRESQLDIPRQRIRQQIAQHPVRQPRIRRRPNGHNSRRQHSLAPRSRRRNVAPASLPACDDLVSQRCLYRPRTSLVDPSPRTATKIEESHFSKPRFSRNIPASQK